MSPLASITLRIVIIITIGTIISASIPSYFTGAVNNSIVYFLSTLGILDFIMPIDTFFACLKLLVNFFSGVAMFGILMWLAKKISP